MITVTVLATDLPLTTNLSSNITNSKCCKSFFFPFSVFKRMSGMRLILGWGNKSNFAFSLPAHVSNQYFFVAEFKFFFIKMESSKRTCPTKASSSLTWKTLTTFLLCSIASTVRSGLPKRPCLIDDCHNSLKLWCSRIAVWNFTTTILHFFKKTFLFKT